MVTLDMKLLCPLGEGAGTGSSSRLIKFPSSRLIDDEGPGFLAAGLCSRSLKSRILASLAAAMAFRSSGVQYGSSSGSALADAVRLPFIGREIIFDVPS
jgi:hypothetical protein